MSKPTVNVATCDLLRFKAICWQNTAPCECDNCEARIAIHNFAAIVRQMLLESTEAEVKTFTVESPDVFLEYPKSVTVKSGTWIGTVSLQMTDDIRRAIGENDNESKKDDEGKCEYCREFGPNHLPPCRSRR